MEKRSNETTYGSHEDLVPFVGAEVPVIEEFPACAHAFNCRDGMLRIVINGGGESGQTRAIHTWRTLNENMFRPVFSKLDLMKS
jgi:hypothetical protein